MPDTNPHHVPVCIVGGGPVGLFLAICLTRIGIKCTVLEQRTGINPHSKSMGIQPVALDLFDRNGITPPFLEAGIKIRQGHAFTGNTRIGTISFDKCPPPHTYILALPQNRTELILEEQLHKMDPGCLIRGASVTGFLPSDDHVRIQYIHNNKPTSFNAGIVAGCDGKNSLVRSAANIGYHGSDYPDTYIMGDFTDNTSFGPDAAIYLHRDGLIESFPLPDGLRRWVVKTDSYVESFRRTLIEEIIQGRIQHSLSGTRNDMLSSFGVQHFLAETFVQNRVVLLGDAAHIISPIGGQGMNLGWLDAQDLADTLKLKKGQGGYSLETLNEWNPRRQKAARQAARNAELNMWLGRKRPIPFFRNSLVRMMVNTPLKRKMARMFTMREITG